MSSLFHLCHVNNPVKTIKVFTKFFRFLKLNQFESGITSNNKVDISLYISSFEYQVRINNHIFCSKFVFLFDLLKHIFITEYLLYKSIKTVQIRNITHHFTLCPQ